MVERKRKPLAIVFDYDDTLVDFVGFLCKIHNNIYNTSITSADILSWDLSDDVINVKDVRGNIVTGQELVKTFKEYEKHGLYASLPTLPDTKHTLTIVRKLGYKIIILTARNESFKQQTLLNLCKHNLPYDEIYFDNQKTKKIRELSKNYNIQMFIDDKVETVVDIFENSNVNKTFLINKPANINIELDEEICRINSVFEIIRFLKDVN